MIILLCVAIYLVVAAVTGFCVGYLRVDWGEATAITLFWPIGIPLGTVAVYEAGLKWRGE